MNKSFTLIEIIIAISVMTIGIVGVYALVPKIVSITGANIDKFIASQLAREGIELVRNIRDTNWLEEADWDEGLTGCSGGCEIDYDDSGFTGYGSGRYLRINTNGFYNYQTGEDTKFKRKIIITPTPDMLKVEVQIFRASATSPIFEAQENLYDWR